MRFISILDLIFSCKISGAPRPLYQVGCEFGNNVDMVAPTRAWNMVEKQNEDLLAQFDDSRDGLNRALRQLRPIRQRPRDSLMTDEERKRLQNEDVGQARTSASSTQDRRREREEEEMAGKYQEDIENPMPAYRNYWQVPMYTS